MPAIDIVDHKVQVLWEGVIRTCNKVMNHANIYGFSLMEIPDPDVHKMARTLEHIVIPILDEVIRNSEFSAESGIKMANIRQYTLHLREITYALDDGDKDKFYENVDILANEAMIV